MNSGDIVLLVLIIPLFAILTAFLDCALRRKEFKRWLKDGRWKYEDFKH